MRRLVPHQFHEPLGRPALDLEHHRLFQRTQPVVDEKERNENRRDADRHEPFIADVTGRTTAPARVRCKLVVKLPDERFQRGAFEPQAEFGDAAFEKFLIAQ